MSTTNEPDICIIVFESIKKLTNVSRDICHVGIRSCPNISGEDKILFVFMYMLKLLKRCISLDDGIDPFYEFGISIIRTLQVIEFIEPRHSSIWTSDIPIETLSYVECYLIHILTIEIILTDKTTLQPGSPDHCL